MNEVLPVSNLDDWLTDLLVDPIGKDHLSILPTGAASSYGKFYPRINQILDFRPFSKLHVSEDAKTWEDGQLEYEAWSKKLAEANSTDYIAEREGVREVYEQFPITGRCLDVGGHQGRLRAFMKPDQEYVIIDPYYDVFRDLDKQITLLDAYPFLTGPVNFLCGVAEYLPFKANSFDTVHMRSVIDHFQNPELALWEAFRVLRNNGQLIVGLYIEGGKTGRLNAREWAKHIAGHVLPVFGINKFVDHHVWHPTYAELCNLIEAIGFKIEHVHWQSQWVDRVCYIQAKKLVTDF